MKATYLSKDNNFTNGSVTYWFNVSYSDRHEKTVNVKMGVVERCDRKAVIIDDESYPTYENTTADYYHYADLIECVTEEIRAK